MVEILECIIVKLLSIIKNEDPRDSKAANDAFPDKAQDILLRDSGQWFYLNPFGEVVDPYDEELTLLYGNGKGSYYVQSPLGERSGALIGVSSSVGGRMMLLKHCYLSHAFT